MPTLGHGLGHGDINDILDRGQLILGQRAAGQVGDDEARRLVDIAVMAEAVADDERLDAFVGYGLERIIQADDGVSPWP